MFRGRYPLGVEIPLSLQCVNGSGVPALPTEAPTADVWSSSAKIRTLAVPPLDPSGVTAYFSYRLFLGSLFAVGLYRVFYRYRIGSFSNIVEDAFEIIPGGHQDGAVISLYGFLRPQATYLVQQLDSGKLVRGKNPRV